MREQEIMKTNKLLISLGLSFLTLSISACANTPSSSSQTKLEEHTLSRSIVADYGRHVIDNVTFLYGGALIPISPSVCGVSNFVVGDYVEITYTGEVLELLTYPSRFSGEMNVVKAELYPARIVEYDVLVVPGDPEKKDLVPTKGYYSSAMVSAEYVINEDGTFVSLESFMKTAKADTKVYGSNPASFNSFNVTALYSYNPRP